MHEAARAIPAGVCALPDRVRGTVSPRLAARLALAPPDERADVAAAAGRHGLWQSVREGAVDGLDRLVAGPAVQEAGRRVHRMEERALPSDHLDGTEVALGRGLAAAREHGDRDPARRDRRRQRTVDRTGLLRWGARVVEAHLRAVDLDHDLEWHGRVVHAIGVHLSAADVAAIGQLLEPAAHDGLAVGVDARGALAEALESVPLDEPRQCRCTGAHADDRRVDVAGHHLRHARVGDREAVDVLDEPTPGVELDAREDRALLEYVDRVGGVGILAADVEPVRLDGRVADELPGGEHRHHHGHVLRVRARAVGHVVEHDVARLERALPAHGLHGGAHAEAHRAHERGQARCLREHRDIAVVERRGEVEHLVDDGRERRAHERALHLLGGRVQALADDLRRNRIHRGSGGGAHARCLRASSAPLGCTSATKPASR